MSEFFFSWLNWAWIDQDQWFSWHISLATARSPTVKFRFDRMVWVHLCLWRMGCIPPKIHHLVFTKQRTPKTRTSKKSTTNNQVSGSQTLPFKNRIELLIRSFHSRHYSLRTGDFHCDDLWVYCQGGDLEDERTLELLQLALDSIEEGPEGDAKWMGGGGPWVVKTPKTRGGWGPFNRRICKHREFPKVVARLHGTQWPSILHGPGKYATIPSQWLNLYGQKVLKLSSIQNIQAEQLKTPSGTWWVKELGVRCFQNCGAGSEYTHVFLSPNNKCIFLGAAQLLGQGCFGEVYRPYAKDGSAEVPWLVGKLLSFNEKYTLEHPEFSLQPRIYLREGNFAESMV